MKTEVTVIYYEALSKKHYVSELSLRWDDKLLAMYSDSKDHARQFENESDAKEKITRIVNHCNHEFQTEPLIVKQSRKNLLSRKAQDALIN